MTDTNAAAASPQTAPTEPPPPPSAEARELAAKVLAVLSTAAKQAREALKPDGPVQTWVTQTHPDWAAWASMMLPIARQRVGDVPELLEAVAVYLDPSAFPPAE